MAEAWTDDDASDWTWHLCCVREPARARRELTGLLSGGTIGLPDPESIRIKPAIAAIFEPTEVKTVPVKKGGQVVRLPGRGKNRIKLKHIQRPLFPGYWFVAPLSGVDWQDIHHADGILGIIREAGSGAPWAARPELMTMFFDRERGVLKRAAAKAVGAAEDFRPGQEVIFASGPFVDFSAIIQSVDKAGRIELLIEMFGRSSTTYADAADLIAA